MVGSVRRGSMRFGRAHLRVRVAADGWSIPGQRSLLEEAGSFGEDEVDGSYRHSKRRDQAAVEEVKGQAGYPRCLAGESQEGFFGHLGTSSIEAGEKQTWQAFRREAGLEGAGQVNFGEGPGGGFARKQAAFRNGLPDVDTHGSG